MAQLPITLAIDTALAACQTALTDDEGNFYAMNEHIGRGHAEHLFDQIDDLLDNAGREYEELERIVVTAGPGSFTGLRVGLAAARGLATALDIPCLGISTLLGLSLSARDQKPVSVLIDARRNQHYRQDFSAPGVPLGEPKALDNDVALEGLDEHSMVLGSGAQWATEQIGVKNLEHNRDPDQRGFVDIMKLVEFGQKADAKAFPPEPCYIRQADAKPQTKKLIERI